MPSIFDTYKRNKVKSCKIMKLTMSNISDLIKLDFDKSSFSLRKGWKTASLVYELKDVRAVEGEPRERLLFLKGASYEL